MDRLGWMIGLLMAASTARAQAPVEQTAPATPTGETGTTDIEAQPSSASPTVAEPVPQPAVEPGKEGTIRDRSVHASRPIGVSLMAYIPWIYGLGIGATARVEIPIVKDGFIPSINDQISLEPSFSIDYRRQNYMFLDEPARYLDLTPAVYATWSFHVSPTFRPYGTLGLGYNIGNWLNEGDFVSDQSVNDSYFYWDLAAGLFYNFSDHVGMRCELGARGPKFGLSGSF